MRVAIITLGCDKNTVDTEYLSGLLVQRGHAVVTEGPQDDIDVLVLMTCGFIEPAREESLATLLAYADTKERLGNPRRIVMAGCLAQRYGEEMADELPEVDAFAGVGRLDQLADLVEGIGSGQADPSVPAIRIAPPDMNITAALPRRAISPTASAFLKIADGCDHRCAFCAIPAIKGPYRSVPSVILLEEARALIDNGVREISLIAQDLAPYGRDLPNEENLIDLLRQLCALEGDFRIRLLYMYPSGITQELIQLMKSEPKLCHYLDVPLQHLDAGVLKTMRRPAGKEDALERIRALRKAVPDVVIRTTMLVGHPGETKKAFSNLTGGMQEMRFERLGAFAFSPEEGTPAVDMSDTVAGEDVERRVARVMKIQAGISADIQKQQRGKTLRVLIEEVGETEENEAIAIGRSYREAPEVDGVIVLREQYGNNRDTILALEPGEFIDVNIRDSDTHDLFGRIA